MRAMVLFLCQLPVWVVIRASGEHVSTAGVRLAIVIFA
jgi:hypothetical protein